MARWFSEDPECSEISVEDKIIRDRIVAIIDRHTREMEGYSYFGRNPGVAVDDYEDIADDIMKELQFVPGA
jgi:hypothetical protein